MAASAAISDDAGGAGAGASAGGHPLGSPGGKKPEADGGVARVRGQVVDFIQAVLESMVRSRAVEEGGGGESRH